MKKEDIAKKMGASCSKCGSKVHTDHAKYQRNTDKARLAHGTNPNYEKE